MTIKEAVEKFKALYLAKNADYGNSADSTFKRFGGIAYMVRLCDKLSRWENLLAKEALVKDESLLDTIGDFFCYSCMWYAAISGVPAVDVMEDVGGITNNPTLVVQEPITEIKNEMNKAIKDVLPLFLANWSLLAYVKEANKFSENT